LPEYLGEKAEGKVVVMHLGYGASLCAMHQRRSVATTMTFTPLDGIPMGTRCGSLDPGVVLYLLRQGMQPDELVKLLYFESGLLGISGVSGDMGTLLNQGTPGAKKAIEQFVHYTVRAIGSLAATLEGLDAIVFTAGIGEHAAAIRAAIVQRCAWLGLDLDEEANSLAKDCISRPGSRIQAWIIPTDEERMIAEHTVRLL
jgi:acetate kinase